MRTHKFPWTIRLLIFTGFLWFSTLGIFGYIKMEGRINPVITPLNISEMNIVENEWTQISGTFTKLRSCLPFDIRWYQGDRRISGRGDRIPVPVRFVDENGDDRAIGESALGDVEISQLWVMLDPISITNDSYAYVYHFCHNRRLWETRSLFYEGRVNY